MKVKEALEKKKEKYLSYHGVDYKELSDDLEQLIEQMYNIVEGKNPCIDCEPCHMSDKAFCRYHTNHKQILQQFNNKLGIKEGE
jgi:hypothetical protein